MPSQSIWLAETAERQKKPLPDHRAPIFRKVNYDEDFRVTCLTGQSAISPSFGKN